MDLATEVVDIGTTEFRQIFSPAGDTPPIYFHLVNVQIPSR